MALYPVFDQCGVSITDARENDESKIEGKLYVRWTETGNRGMCNVFDYFDLPSRKTAMMDAVKFAGSIMCFTDF